MSPALTVAVVGSNEVAHQLGKKGTVSDLTLYHDVHGDRALTLVEPTQFPEKVAPLAVALAMADACIVAVPELTRPVAEAIAFVELAELPTTVALGPGVGEGDLARALKGSRLETAPRVPLEPLQLRARLEAIEPPPVREGAVEVPVDHAFPVKGVGAVALGLVRRGTLRAHDRLRLYPGPKTVEVRSIQVHDIDRSEATCGERVGVALRGVDSDELERGQTLALEGSLAVATTLEGPLVRCRYYRGDAGSGAQLHLGVGLAVVPAEVDRLDATSVRVTADRPVALRPGAPAFLYDLSASAGPRILGRFTASPIPSP